MNILKNMSTTISLLGCGRTGVQTSIVLLERFAGTLAVYDEDTDYAKGMALDFMQASSVQGYHGHVHAAENSQILIQSDVLIVGEYRDETAPSVQTIESLMKDIPVCIYACSNPSPLSNISSNRIFGVHAMVNAAILKHHVANEIDIAQKDIEVMMRSDVENVMQSAPEMVRVNGIPVNEIVAGSYERALEKAQKFHDDFESGPWNIYYTFASAAAEAALLVVSGQGAIIPVTTTKGSIAARVDKTGYKELEL